ncbi:MAG: DNA primase [Tepidisphaeraceae bacterium]
MSGPNAGSDFRALVLSATDIADLIGRTVSLKRRGKDFVGLCPFHQEKTPSFHVSSARQFFHCYGCKAGGNAIDFVMKRDRVEFIDALRTLGEMAGLEMPRRGGASNEKAGERQQLLEACSAAGALFEKLLSHPEIGQAARAYLEQRGFDAESIKRFQIGFAPNAWDTALNALSRKFPAPLLQQAGLVKARESGDGFYDTFRNRVMFPIRDEQGRVIAFGGRVMPGSEDPAQSAAPAAKYLNSPETPLFSKGKSVFGLDLARQRVVETRIVAVVEGYTDVVMAHQFGVTNVVSILGTAMTEPHVNMLRRFADRIVLLFDADEAGDTAVSRAVELFMTQPVDFAVAAMPDKTDPDEYLMQHGAEAFEKLLKDAPSVLQFMVRQFKRRWDTNEENIPEREKAVQAFMDPFIKARAEAAVDDGRWSAVMAALSKAMGLSIDELHRRYGGLVRKKARATAQARLAVRSAVPATARDAAQVPATGEPTNNAPAATPRRPLTGRDVAERRLLGVLLTEPARWHQVQQHVRVADFADESRRRLAEVYWAHQRDEGEPVFNEFLSELEKSSVGGSPLAELAIELVEEIDALPGREDVIADALLLLDEARRARETEKLTASLGRTEMQAGEQDQILVLKKLSEFAAQSNKRRIM